ncbi:type IV pilus modification protein PilV [Pantoea sp. 18069]|uniref:type IV pilus modification protein PilV n=1 Tax=Pantoea sp. 18069 TaxID=2681415 RepID=UPI00135AB0FB|nr:type IV pilus modification protein PilV [Pantoea sp. 18069]
MLKSLPTRERGITLLESLVAIVVMALGVLGILGVQMRTLADNQTSVRRAQAVRMIEDLSERIRMNPRGLAELSQYTVGWETKPPAAGNCATNACGSASLATDDRNLWLANVQQTLPLGDAAVFLVADETNNADRRQLGVMISWRENEKVVAGETQDDQAAYKAVLQPTGTGTAAISCPPERSCHLQYIQPSARCLPYAAGAAGASLAICPG